MSSEVTKEHKTVNTICMCTCTSLVTRLSNDICVYNTCRSYACNCTCTCTLYM